MASFNVISSQSVRLRNERQPIFLIRKSLLCECGCQGYHTLQAIFNVVAWSFKCLKRGVSPDCRHDGTPFTQFDRQNRMAPNSPLPCAALLQVRGDWEWLVQCFRLRSFNSDNFCWMCDTTNAAGPLCFHDMRPEAAHRQTCVTHEAYMASCFAAAEQPSFLFRCPGVMLKHIGVDTMHSADLGCFQDALGSLFYLEIMNKGWYRNKATGLRQLNQDLLDFYTAQAKALSRVTPLTMSQIKGRDLGYPYLKCKAAQTRHLASFGLLLARLHKFGDASRSPFVVRPGSRLAPQLNLHLDLLVAMFEGFAGYTVACARVPFPEEECRQAMHKFLQSLTALHQLWRAGIPANAHKFMPFVLRQKSHVLQHLVEDKIGLWGSPSAFWCYRDEDYIGTVKGIASKTKHPFTLETRLLEKLMIWTKIQNMGDQEM